MRNTKPLSISVEPELKDKIERLAEAKDMTKSQLLRTSFKTYLNNEMEELIFRKQMQKEAEKLGLEDIDDVVELVKELRE
ncbi:MAG: ribbon-helix-helix protein, CopG family [Candidatus Paceibacteria bacterium]